ncbi:MAG TPA: protein phosphatase 2C domain-containing protein [Caldimonas sp.]|nr:protein phosphatase 2C domain-containing protein [Caldimonas sp.]
MALSSSGLITPIEPGRTTRPGALATAAPAPTHAVYANASGRLEAAVASSCGSQHAVNEDAHSALDGAGRLFVVADGVGGGAMAQTASRLLVAQLHDALAAPPLDAERVAAAMLGADRTIAEAIARVTERPGAATVALCATLDAAAARWLVAWVGDCRVYRWSPRGAGRLDLLTRDDTFGQLGEAPPPGGSANDPARMVGNGATTGANAAVHELGRDEVLVLCSDGVHKHLDGADWCRALAAPVSLAERGRALVALARSRGSVDDATALLLHRADPGGRSLRWNGRGAAPSETERSQR